MWGEEPYSKPHAASRPDGSASMLPWGNCQYDERRAMREVQQATCNVRCAMHPCGVAKKERPVAPALHLQRILCGARGLRCIPAVADGTISNLLGRVYNGELRWLVSAAPRVVKVCRLRRMETPLNRFNRRDLIWPNWSSILYGLWYGRCICKYDSDAEQSRRATFPL